MNSLCILKQRDIVSTLLFVNVLLFSFFTSLSLGNGRWRKISFVNGTEPPELLGSIGSWIENTNSFLIYGGCTSSCCYAPIDELWLAEFVSETAVSWTLVEQSFKPPARFYTAAVPTSSSTSLVMFGGIVPALGFQSDLWQLSWATHSTQRSSFTWNQLNKANSPPPRAGHAMCLLGKDTLLVYGGTGFSGALADIWMTSVHNLNEPWNELKPDLAKGESPVARVNPTLTCMSGPDGIAKLYIFGGSDSEGVDHNSLFEVTLHLGLGSAEWMEQKTDLPVPFARHSHTLLNSVHAKNQGSDSGEIVIFGGQHGTLETDPFLNDLWKFDVMGGEWSELYSGNYSMPTKRAYATTIQPETAYLGTLLFAGFSGYYGEVDDRLHNDLWIFN